MAQSYRVALSGDFRKPDGSPTFPDFDLGPLKRVPNVEMVFLESNNPLAGNQLENFDALILLAHRFAAESVPKSGRLAVVARFGVGYDTVDVPACTANDIALVITPDGVRRPVAVSIVTFMLALTGKLMVKDKLARMGKSGFAVRGEHMGVGVVGRVTDVHGDASGFELDGRGHELGPPTEVAVERRPGAAGVHRPSRAIAFPATEGRVQPSSRGHGPSRR